MVFPVPAVIECGYYFSSKSSSIFLAKGNQIQLDFCEMFLPFELILENLRSSTQQKNLTEEERRSSIAF